MALQITIKAGSSLSDSSVMVTGQDVHIITNDERKTFGIGSDNDLKRAVERYFGRYPTDAYVRSPTPWGDLYTRYNWPQVQTVLTPKSWRILELPTNNLILTSQIFDNSGSSRPTTFTAQLSAEVKDSASTTWSNSQTISVEQMIKYGINFVLVAEGETSMKFEASWGKSVTHTREITLSASSSVTVELEPGAIAEAILNASKGSMKIRVVYEATLRGTVAVNYNPTYQGHHFWGLGVGSVVGSANNKVEIVQDITVDFYTSMTAAVRDKNKMALTDFFYALPAPDDEETDPSTEKA